MGNNYFISERQKHIDDINFRYDIINSVISKTEEFFDSKFDEDTSRIITPEYTIHIHEVDDTSVGVRIKVFSEHCADRYGDKLNIGWLELLNYGRGGISSKINSNWSHDIDRYYTTHIMLYFGEVAKIIAESCFSDRNTAHDTVDMDE